MTIKQTALMVSIQRKKDRVKKLEDALQKHRPGQSDERHNYWAIIDALKVEIAEDEKLLRADREQRRNLYVNGFHDGQSSPEMLIDDEVVQKYNEKYGSDETHI